MYLHHAIGRRGADQIDLTVIRGVGHDGIGKRARAEDRRRAEPIHLPAIRPAGEQLAGDRGTGVIVRVIDLADRPRIGVAQDRNQPVGHGDVAIAAVHQCYRRSGPVATARQVGPGQVWQQKRQAKQPMQLARVWCGCWQGVNDGAVKPVQGRAGHDEKKDIFHHTIAWFTRPGHRQFWRELEGWVRLISSLSSRHSTNYKSFFDSRSAISRWNLCRKRWNTGAMITPMTLTKASPLNRA